MNLNSPWLVVVSLFNIIFYILMGAAALNVYGLILIQSTTLLSWIYGFGFFQAALQVVSALCLWFIYRREGDDSVRKLAPVTYLGFAGNFVNVLLMILAQFPVMALVYGLGCIYVLQVGIRVASKES